MRFSLLYYDHLRTSPLFVLFAIDSGWSKHIVDLFHDMDYLYDVLDTFTCRLVPYLRNNFLELSKAIENEKKGGLPATFSTPNPMGMSPTEMLFTTIPELAH